MKESINRKIFLEPLWKLHVGYHLNELFNSPPPGYEFIINNGRSSIISRMSQISVAPILYSHVGKIAPLNLLKSYMSSKITKIPNECELIYCCNHLSFRKQLWVAEMDAIWDPIGPSYKVFRLYQSILERTILSDQCRAVLTFSEFSKQILISILKTSAARRKIVFVPRAVHQKSIVADGNRKDFHILFIGSANLAGEFEMRGGKEVLEAFRTLNEQYPNIHLTIRSDIPNNIVKKYMNILSLPTVRWIRGWVDKKTLEELYKSASILLLPGHYDNWLVTLEAMSYGLPVIATDIYANRERIDHGKTGFLVQSARHVPYYQGGLPLFTFDAKFQNSIRVIDKRVVDAIVEKITILIGNNELTIRMGEMARMEVVHGKFSIDNRNKILKRVFDEALS